jgi:hypothetical protein
MGWDSPAAADKMAVDIFLGHVEDESEFLILLLHREDHMSSASVAVESPQMGLVSFFRRNGCWRSPDQKRRKTAGTIYKKGYELRFVARTTAELKRIRRMLVQCGFKPGASYSKGQQIVQPVYGHDAFSRFQSLVH